jgi:hypothetical protein
MMSGVLKAKVVPVASLTEKDRYAMYGLMVRYYDHMQWDRFNKDLDQKQDVILLLAGKGREIKGFSTLMTTEATVNGKTARAIYSGDTVVDKAYWGQRVLGRKFLSYILSQKLKHPTSALYWFLISKGYKTYLLMANNALEYYPRYEMPTPADKQELLDAFATNMFGDAYQPETGLLKFPESLGQLREGVADITEEELSSNQRIKYFVERNPNWKNGDELVCIANMSWLQPLQYATKSWLKLASKLAKGKVSPAPLPDYKDAPEPVKNS